MQYRFSAGRRQVVEPFLCVPESLDLTQDLPARLASKRLDDAYYPVSLITWKLANGHTDELGRVPLMANRLTDVMAKDDYAEVMRHLLSSGVIHRDRYIVGEKSYSYWIDSRFENDKHVIRPVKCKRMIRALKRQAEKREEELNRGILPIHAHLRDMQASLTINMDQASEILPTFEDSFDTQSILVNRLNEGVYSFSLSQYGRVSNSISNLKSDLRCSLRLQDQPLACLDLSNSQPALLGKIIKDKGKNENGERDRTANHIYDSENRVGKIELDRKEVAEYLELVQTGTFYFELHKAFPHIDIDDFKPMVLANVFAKKKIGPNRIEYQSPIEDHFRSRFPTIHRFIRWFNYSDHAALIRWLQVEESQLVIEMVSETLRTQSPDLMFITLHDAIYAALDRMDEVQRAFQVAFKVNDFSMKMKLTPDLSRPKETVAA